MQDIGNRVGDDADDILNKAGVFVSGVASGLGNDLFVVGNSIPNGGVLKVVKNAVNMGSNIVDAAADQLMTA